MILNWCLIVLISQTYSAASRHSLEGEDRGRGSFSILVLEPVPFSLGGGRVWAHAYIRVVLMESVLLPFKLPNCTSLLVGTLRLPSVPGHIDLGTRLARLGTYNTQLFLFRRST